MKYYIGLDLGTSSLKGVLINEKNKVIKTSSFDYPIYFPKDGYSEQNPSDWLDATRKVIKELSLGKEDKIYGLSIAGQMHGLVTLDKDDNIIRPCILWNDNRSVEETNYLNNIIGKEKLNEYTGNIAFTGFSAPKILWMQNNELELWNKVDKIMLPKDYLVYMLTEVFSSDYSDASGMLLLDVKNKCWSKQMLEICHVKENQLPKLYESYEVVGQLKEEYGLPNCKVTAGCGDNAGAAIGTNTIHNGECNISLGTGGTIFIATDNFKEDKTNGIHSFCHSNGKYHLMACILSAASARKWWLENVLESNDYQKDEQDMNGTSTDVIFLPYLNGERSPYNDPNIRGMFYNLSASTTKKELSLAVLEGVAFALKTCLEQIKEDGVNIQKATICGGGAKSDLWCQIISNVLEIPIARLKDNLGPSFGAALLAKAENNISTDINIDKVFIPLLNTNYSKKYENFKKLYQLIK